MKKRKRDYAAEHRAAFSRAKAKLQELLKLLGGECAKCGAKKYLHVDHIEGRSWQPRDLSYHNRVRRYWKEFREGVKLRVLCKSCNGWGGAKMAQMYENRRRAEEEGH